MTTLPSTVDDAFSRLERLNEKSFFYRQVDIVGLKVDNRTVRWMRDTQDVTSQLFAYAGSVIAFFPCLAIGLGAEFLSLSRMTKITIMASAAAIAALCWYFSKNKDNSEENSTSGTSNNHTFIGGSTHSIHNVGNSHNTYNTYNTYNTPAFQDTSTSSPSAPPAEMMEASANDFNAHKAMHDPNAQPPNYDTCITPGFPITSTSLPTENDANVQDSEPVSTSAFDRAFHKSLATCALASGVVGASIGSAVSLVIVPPISGTVNALEYMVSDYSPAPA